MPAWAGHDGGERTCTAGLPTPAADNAAVAAVAVGACPASRFYICIPDASHGGCTFDSRGNAAAFLDCLADNAFECEGVEPLGAAHDGFFDNRGSSAAGQATRSAWRNVLGIDDAGLCCHAPCHALLAVGAWQQRRPAAVLPCTDGQHSHSTGKCPLSPH